MINKNNIYLYSLFFTFKYLANDTCEFLNLTINTKDEQQVMSTLVNQFSWTKTSTNGKIIPNVTLHLDRMLKEGNITRKERESEREKEKE